MTPSFTSDSVLQSQKKFALGSGPTSLLGTSACLGAEVLLKLLGNYCRNADIKTSITVGVVGRSKFKMAQTLSAQLNFLARSP